MNSWKTTACVLALALCSTAASARSTEMNDPDKVLFLTQGTPLTLEQVRGRVVGAAQGLGWQATKDERGRMELMYDKGGKHQVTIEVLYDAAGYDINYVKSSNLNYEEQDGKRRIHPTYNRWIKNLSKQIATPGNASSSSSNRSLNNGSETQNQGEDK